MVTGMSLAMSVIGLALSGAPLTAMPVQFALAWSVNFCAAFFWQMFAAVPIARGALRLFRRYNRNADVVVATVGATRSFRADYFGWCRPLWYNNYKQGLCRRRPFFMK